MNYFKYILFFILLTSQALAQVNIRDSSIFIPLFSVSYATQIPEGDLSERFGWNSNVGASFLIKTKKNFIYGADGYFLFGAHIKEDNILDMLKTEKGAIIDKNGEYANIVLYERGFTFSAKFGKLFPILGKNLNSGFFATAGVGFLQHKIRIEDVGNNAPQLKDDYKKGYDRLTNGLLITEFVGYQYLGNKRLINFFVGVEFLQAFTQNRRDYNFDTMSKDDVKRTDLLYGLRVGWIIPFYKRATGKFYYY